MRLYVEFLLFRVLTIKFVSTYLRVVPRSSFVRVCTPLLVLGPRPRRKERYIVTSVLFALLASVVIVCSSGGIEVWCHLYGTVGRCMFRTRKMEHFNRLGVQ